MPIPSSSPDRIFNKNHLRAHRRRAAFYKTDGYDFLLRWAEQNIIDRLDDIKRTFGNALLLVPEDTPKLKDYLEKRGTLIDILFDAAHDESERLTPKRTSYDLIISLFELQHLNDPVGWLIQMRRHLVEDGALITGFIGGETLHQLRQSLLESELELTGGASPRIFPFMDRLQLAGLMQRAGFAGALGAENLVDSFDTALELARVTAVPVQA